MGRLLIIGCGGVAGVAIHKCCQNSKTFSEICIASRTKAKCDALKEKLENTTETKITTGRTDRTDPVLSAGCCFKCGTSVPGSDDHGCVSGMQGGLY